MGSVLAETAAGAGPDSSGVVDASLASTAQYGERAEAEQDAADDVSRSMTIEEFEGTDGKTTDLSDSVDGSDVIGSLGLDLDTSLSGYLLGQRPISRTEETCGDVAATSSQLSYDALAQVTTTDDDSLEDIESVVDSQHTDL